VRILLVSDLPFTLPQLDWLVRAAPSCDLVVMAGDPLDISSSVPLNAQSVVILRYLALLQAAGRVVISSGNHDLTGPDAQGEQAALWLAEARWLSGLPLAAARVAHQQGPAVDGVPQHAWRSGFHSGTLGGVQQHRDLADQRTRLGDGVDHHRALAHLQRARDQHPDGAVSSVFPDHLVAHVENDFGQVERQFEHVLHVCHAERRAASEHVVVRAPHFGRRMAVLRG